MKEILGVNIIEVAINGANGRMGKAIQEVLLQDTYGVDLVGKFTKNATEHKHNIGLNSVNAASRGWKDLAFNSVDVIIDFSSEEGLRTLLQHANCKIVSGTTGLSEETFQMMKKYGEEKNGIIWGSNTSFGVNLLFAMVKKMASMLDGKTYDAEVYERHHRMKKDAPSGTALTIGKKIAEGRNHNFVPRDYSIQGERKENEVGFAVERGGQTKGFHEARFISDDETLWIGHEAHDRSIFAKGAIKLAKIAIEQDIHGYHEVSDVFQKLLQL